jgi:serine protease SohB
LEFLTEYGMFLAKAVTIVVAIGVVIGLIASLGQKSKKTSDGQIQIANISEDIESIKDDLDSELLSEEEYKKRQKDKKKREKFEQKANKKKLKETTKDSKASDSDDKDSDDDSKKRLFVVDFDGDVEASAVENLREEISAIVSVAEKGDQVLVRLESPGGMVHAYGLAASQLSRIKQANLELIVAVDQVAASGGYMMACVADKIIAAPFAVVGSIGVVAEIPNFLRLLKHNKVDYELHTAGEFKRTLTMFAENTDAARDKFKGELEETHDLFKRFITENRASLDVEKVATGEHWYGIQAKELGLVDELQTSDDYILNCAKEQSVYSISYEVKKTLSQRLSVSLQSAVEKSLLSLWQKSLTSRLFK